MLLFTVLTNIAYDAEAAASKLYELRIDVASAGRLPERRQIEAYWNVFSS
jgi:hypothetical protein